MSNPRHSVEMEREFCCETRGAFLLLAAYRLRVLRPVIRTILVRLERGLTWSVTWRRIMEKYEGVTIGAYSYGPGLRASVLPRGSEIGRFSSVAAGLKVLSRNHPMSRLSQHPLFYDRRFGLVQDDDSPHGSLVIARTFGSEWT